MNRKEVLKEAIRKMLPLEMPDKELIQNLVESGVTKQEAKEALEEVKLEPKTDSEVAEQEREELFPTTEKTVSKKSFSVPEPEPKVFTGDEEGTLDLWSKGILATIDAKITQMEKIRSGLDQFIDKKVEKALERQTKKYEAVFESQRVLTIEKVNHLLEEKTNEFDDLVSIKALELKKLGALSEEYFKKLESQRKFLETMLETIDAKVSSFEDKKTGMLSGFSNEMSVLRADVGKFLKESEQKRNEINDRINTALHLENQIVEGVLSDATNKVDQITSTRVSELSNSVFSKMEGLEKSLSDKIERKIKEINEIQKQIDVDTIKTTMEDLEIFRKQFVSNIQNSTGSFDKAKKELVLLIEKREGLIDKRVELIDSKIKELNEFEKKLVEELGVAIETAAEKKASEKLSSPPQKSTISPKMPKKA